MDKNTVRIIRKTSSGLGFMLFTASLSMTVIVLILYLSIGSKLDTTAQLMMQIYISVISIFIVGLIYCWFSKTALDSVISVKWVKLSLALPLIFAALAVSLSSDYLTEVLLSNLSLFGIKNSYDLDTATHTVFENIVNIVCVSVVPPLVEEFMFRGLLLGKLRYFGDSFALLMSSMLFGVMHGNIVQIPFAFIVGLSLAFITIKCDSILPAIIVHFIINFRSVLVSIILDNKIMSEETTTIIYLALVLAIFVLGIISSVILSRKKDFFKLDSKPGIPLRRAVKTSILSVGMMFFLIHSIFTVLETISISWLDFSKLLD